MFDLHFMDAFKLPDAVNAVYDIIAYREFGQAEDRLAFTAARFGFIFAFRDL